MQHNKYTIQWLNDKWLLAFKIDITSSIRLETCYIR